MATTYDFTVSFFTGKTYYNSNDLMTIFEIYGV